MQLFQLTVRDLISAWTLSIIGSVLDRPGVQWHELVPSRSAFVMVPLRVAQWAAPVLIVFAFVHVFNFVRWCVS